MAAHKWPLGQAISFGAVSFPDGTSTLISCPSATGHDAGTIAGSEDTFDTGGDAPLPIDSPLWVYEFWSLVADNIDHTVPNAALQAVWTALMQAITDVTSGVSGRVGTLTVLDWSSGNVTARARLVEVQLIETNVSSLKFRATFMVNGGFS